MFRYLAVALGESREWAEDEKPTDNLGDEMSLSDQRLRLLVHVICPEWVKTPELFAESRLTDNDTLKLDKIDQQQITDVGLYLFVLFALYAPNYVVFFSMHRPWSSLPATPTLRSHGARSPLL